MFLNPAVMEFQRNTKPLEVIFVEATWVARGFFSTFNVDWKRESGDESRKLGRMDGIVGWVGIVF